MPHDAIDATRPEHDAAPRARPKPLSRLGAPLAVTLRGQRRTWRLGERLCLGGQAVVQEAWGDGVHAAVKRAGRREGADALRLEARAMIELAAAADDASWLVPVLDEGEDEAGLPFYVMPWFERTLHDHLAAPLLERLDLLVQAAAAVRRLHATHRGAIVAIHRDIKPANLLTAREGGRPRLRIADFGILRQQARFTEQTNAVAFSWQYAPPEQLLPLLGEPDPSVDVFSLAAVVFHALSQAGPPAASEHAADAFTVAGADLRALTVAGSAGERFESLRRRPVTELIHPDAPALTEPERAALRNRLEDALADSGVRDDALAADLPDLLLPVLEHALRPCPRVRQADATRLWDALKDAHDRVARALGQPAWTPPSDAPAAVAPDATVPPAGAPTSDRPPEVPVASVGAALAASGDLAPAPAASGHLPLARTASVDDASAQDAPDSEVLAVPRDDVPTQDAPDSEVLAAPRDDVPTQDALDSEIPPAPRDDAPAQDALDNEVPPAPRDDVPALEAPGQEVPSAAAARDEVPALDAPGQQVPATAPPRDDAQAEAAPGGPGPVDVLPVAHPPAPLPPAPHGRAPSPDSAPALAAPVTRAPPASRPTARVIVALVLLLAAGAGPLAWRWTRAQALNPPSGAAVLTPVAAAVAPLVTDVHGQAPGAPPPPAAGVVPPAEPPKPKVTPPALPTVATAPTAATPSSPAPRPAPTQAAAAPAPSEPPPAPPVAAVTEPALPAPSPVCVRLTALADGGVPDLDARPRPRDLRACDGDPLTVSYAVDGVSQADRRILRLERAGDEVRWRLGADAGVVRGETLSLRWSRVTQVGRWRASGG